MANRTGISFQKVPSLFIIMLGFVLMVGAVSCQAQTPEEISEVEESTMETEVMADPTPTDEVEEAEMVEEVAVVVDECLACHTDKQTLIDTAAPVVDLESESSGEG